MESLLTIVPDVEVLLAMAPEELAGIILRLARSRVQNGMFHPESISPTSGYTGISAAQVNLYPSHRMNAVEVALSEAWQWLRINMLVVPAAGVNGQNGWMVISRRGMAIADDQDFQSFREAAAFPKSLLHPAIEPPRVLRRLQHLREWSHEQVKQVFT